MMGIDAMNAYGGLFNYYRVGDLPVVDVATVEKQDAEVARKREEEASWGSIGTSLTTSSPTRPQASRVANLEDVSLSFSSPSLDELGRDSSLDLLDIEQAISDMKKDEILEDYQYFVGSGMNQSMMTSSPDGTVIQKNAFF